MSMVSIGGPDLSGLRRSIEKCNMWNSILRVFWQSRKIALFWFRRYVAHEDQTQMGFAFSNLMWMLSGANLQVGDSSFLLLALSAKTKFGSIPKNRPFLCIFDLLYFHRVSSPETHIYRVARARPSPYPIQAPRVQSLPFVQELSDKVWKMQNGQNRDQKTSFLNWDLQAGGQPPKVRSDINRLWLEVIW